MLGEGTRANQSHRKAVPWRGVNEPGREQKDLQEKGNPAGTGTRRKGKGTLEAKGVGRKEQSGDEAQKGVRGNPKKIGTLPSRHSTGIG